MKIAKKVQVKNRIAIECLYYRSTFCDVDNTEIIYLATQHNSPRLVISMQLSLGFQKSRNLLFVC